MGVVHVFISLFQESDQECPLLIVDMLEECISKHKAWTVSMESRWLYVKWRRQSSWSPVLVLMSSGIQTNTLCCLPQWSMQQLHWVPTVPVGKSSAEGRQTSETCGCRQHHAWCAGHFLPPHWHAMCQLGQGRCHFHHMLHGLVKV